MNRRFARKKAVRRPPSFCASLEQLEIRQMLTATITVNSTADTNARDSVLTFREALLINNRTLSVASLSAAEQSLVSGTPTSADRDTIQFNIPVTDLGHFYYKDDGIAGQLKLTNLTATTAASDGGIADIDPDWAHSWFSIRTTSQLPSIIDPVIINGYSQAGAAANTNAVGQGLNTVLKIELDGENAGQVDGLLRLEDGDNTEIRGLAMNRALGAEIKIEYFADGTVVQGNYIGTDISGTQAFAFTNPGSVPGYLRSSGVYAEGAGVLVGGTTAADRNLISGNSWPISASIVSAVVLRGFNMPSTVQGNIIGADRTGTKVLGNAGSGVLLDSPNNIIGGADPNAGNVISGNQSASINFASLNVTGTLVQNNKLGTDPTGTLQVGTTGGINIANTASNNQILENTIAFGLGILAGSGTGNLISRNSIFSNVGLGIDLGGDGVTPNDVPPASNPPDQDGGANNRQNYPTISSLTNLGPGSRIQGTLASTPNSTFRLEFFSAAERDESNSTVAEGQTYLGFVDVSTNGSGNATFSVDLGALPVGQPYVTATATDITNTGSGPANDTSEFSPVATLGGVSFVVTTTSDSGPGSLREAIINANSTSGAQTISFNIPASDPRHFFYLDDGIAGKVSPDHIAATTESNDTNIIGIDPDWAHSWFSIRPTRNLPDIIGTTIIDGYSQAGSSANTLPALAALDTVLKIELDGENASGDGLKFTFGGIIGTNFSDASGSTVKGLAINNFGGNGVTLDTLSGGNVVAGSYIGADVSGLVDAGNGGNGVFVSRESGSTIGGSDAAARILISGNEEHAIKILSSPRTTVEGYLIGSNALLTQPLFNTGGGALVIFGAAGTATANAAASASSSADLKNYAAETMPAQKRTTFFGEGLMAIGYATALIGAQELDEIEDEEESPAAEDLGVAVSQAVIDSHFSNPPLPQLHSESVANALAAATSNVEYLQIDLGRDGATPNDAGDLDRWQNSPVISSATTIAGATTVTGTLHSVANTTFRVEFFSNTFGPNFRAGEKYLGFANVTTNSAGNASYHFNSPELVSLGEFVTATATRLQAGTLALIKTSEFSRGVEVSAVSPADQIIALGSDRGSDTRSRVKVLDAQTGAVLTTFTPYGNSFHGGVRVAVADLDHDGTPEIITAPGADKNRTPLVKVFDLSGHELTQYRINAYESSFRGGVFVAAADVDGDGWTDIITTPDKGRKVEVRYWHNRLLNAGNPTDVDPFASTASRTFRAFEATYIKGATVAAGDFTGDGKAEIVVGNGSGKSPVVRIFDLTTFTTTGLAPRLREIKPFSGKGAGGVFVAVADLRGTSTPEIIVGNTTGGQVELYNANGSRFKTIVAYTGSSANAPIHVAAKNVDASAPSGDVYDEVLTAQGVSGSSRRLRSWQPDATLIDDVLQSDFDFRHGYFVA